MLPCGNPVLLIWVGLSNDTPNKTSVNKHEHGPNMLYLRRHTHTHTGTGVSIEWWIGNMAKKNYIYYMYTISMCDMESFQQKHIEQC